MIQEGAYGFKNRYIPEAAVDNFTCVFSATYRVDDTDNAEAIGSPYKAVSSLGIGCGQATVCQNQCCVLQQFKSPVNSTLQYLFLFQPLILTS
jgi:hypothetical protein